MLVWSPWAVWNAQPWKPCLDGIPVVLLDKQEADGSFWRSVLTMMMKPHNAKRSKVTVSICTCGCVCVCTCVGLCEFAERVYVCVCAYTSHPLSLCTHVCVYVCWLASFISTWHRLESFRKRDFLLRKRPHQMGLWAIDCKLSWLMIDTGWPSPLWVRSLLGRWSWSML